MEFMSLDELMSEVDANVRRLTDIFRFTLNYRILLHGSGIEFSELREYVRGEDDPKRIDWKASLRANRLYVKDFEEERNLDVFILLDTSSSMLFGTQEKLKSEYAAVLAGTLVYAGIEAGDNVGFCMFNDKIMNYIPPSQDKSTYYSIIKLMVNPAFYGGGCNLNRALMNIMHVVSPKTILFIISDFIGVGDDWIPTLKMVSAKLDRVFGIMVRDIRDSVLPDGVGNIRVSDPFTERAIIVNMDKVKKSFNEEAKTQEELIFDEFQSSKAKFVKIHTNEAFIQPLVKYLEVET